MSKKIKTIGPNGIDFGDRGVYDKRNILNDLTGREWIYFTNSVWITGYSPTAKENVGLSIRKIHPSPKPPGLMKDIIEFFTKSDGWIFDPFAGVGGTLLGAALAEGNRNVIGMELESDYITAYKNVCKNEHLREMVMINDDSRNMLNHPEINNQVFDLIIADPPYSNMMAKERSGQSKKKNNDSAPRPYTEEENDLGNLPYEKFLSSLRQIIKNCSMQLKNKGYIVIFCKDFQPVKGNPNILHADMINEIVKIKGVEYKGLRIWHDQAMSLYPFGYPYSFVMNQIHQYILIFRKEE